LLRSGHQLAHAVLQADAREVRETSSISPSYLQRLQVLLGGVQRAEAEGARDLVARGRRTAFR